MNVPTASAEIRQCTARIISDLMKSDFAENNVDLQVEILGVLNYTDGMKIRLTYVDSFEDEDVLEWREIAARHGAIKVSTRTNTASGHIDLNIEYKGSGGSLKINKIWLLRVCSLLIASWSYQQLHLMNDNRYPWPSV
jgi:hypothetical protein